MAPNPDAEQLRRVAETLTAMGAPLGGVTPRASLDPAVGLVERPTHLRIPGFATRG